MSPGAARKPAGGKTSAAPVRTAGQPEQRGATTAAASDSAGDKAPAWELAPDTATSGTGVEGPLQPRVSADPAAAAEGPPLPDGAQPLAADRVDAARFYYYRDGKFYRSSDGGRSFSRVGAALPVSRWHVLRAEPGARQSLWLALDHKGLLHSSDGGKTFTKLRGVAWAHLLAFGKPQSGGAAQGPAALYLFGVLQSDLDNQPALYRSLDQGGSWLRISVPETALGAAPQVLEASRDHFGLVFIGTAGRGLFYGSPL